MTSVSVVMVSYHTGPCLWLAIESALAEAECAEIILVNNGNPPGIEALLREREKTTPRLRLISGHGNVGFAKACNLGARAAKGDYILLLNPDSMLPKGGLARALEHMERAPEKTMAGCFLANPSGSEQRGGRRALLTPRNAMLESLGLSFMLPKDERLNLNTTRMPETVHEVPAISGAFMLLRRSYYQKLGGMDEGYFLHMEDMDLCYRVQKSGGKILCMPDVKVVHFRSTSDVTGGFVEKAKAKSFVYYLRRHFTDSSSSFIISVLAAGIHLRCFIKRCVNSVNRIFEPALYGKQYVARLVMLHRITRFGPQDDSLAGRVVLVTGATGELGLDAVADLLARGAEVLAVYHRTRVPFTHDRLSWVERDLEKNARALAHAKVDTVIHAADLTMLPKLLPDILESGAKRLVAFSCAPLLDKARARGKADRQRAGRYAAAEKEVLEACHPQDCRVTLLRPTGLYGVGLDSGITRLAHAISRFGKLPLAFPAKGLRQPVHVRDVSAALMRVLDNPITHGKTYALAGAGSFAYREMLERLFVYLGKPARFIRVPAKFSTLLTTLGRLYNLQGVSGDMLDQMNRDVTVSNEEAARDFGYSPRGFLQGETGL